MGNRSIERAAVNCRECGEEVPFGGCGVAQSLGYPARPPGWPFKKKIRLLYFGILGRERKRVEWATGRSNERLEMAGSAWKRFLSGVVGSRNRWGGWVVGRFPKISKKKKLGERCDVVGGYVVR